MAHQEMPGAELGSLELSSQEVRGRKQVISNQNLAEKGWRLLDPDRWKGVCPGPTFLLNLYAANIYLLSKGHCDQSC